MDTNYNCIECRKCEENCSIFIATGKDGPIEKLKILDLLRNDVEITDDQIQTVFNCTKCEACQNSCPQEIPLIKLYDWARHEIHAKYGLRNPKQSILIQNIVNTGNPFGHEDSRLEGVSREFLKEKMEYEFKKSETRTLLHLGCMLGYRLHSMRDDVLAIFNLLNIDYTLLRDEQCCGYFVWNTGDHETAEEIIEQNAKVFDQYDKIICACAGCYTFFKENYPNNEKFHHCIQIIDEELKKLQDNGNLISNKNEEFSKKSIVFHDSCHLTRPHGVVEPPRRTLKTMEIDFKNYPHAGMDNLCCGADGGLRIVNPKLAVKIGRDRVNEAIELDCDTILTLCPFCIFNFRDAASEEEIVDVESLYHYIKDFLELNLKRRC